MILDSALQDMQRTLPQCIATGVVDMRTGLLLGVHTAYNQSQQILDPVAPATGDAFYGQSVSAIVDMLRESGGVAQDRPHYF